MAILNSTAYLAFASFTVASNTYYVGTQAESRGGQWYDGVLKEAPQLAAHFGDALGAVQVANVNLIIGDGAGGTYRTLVDANRLDGVVVTVTVVQRSFWSDGSQTDATVTQQLTIIGTALGAGTVTLKLTDVESTKLQALYPPDLWQAIEWPELSSDDAGKPICEAVGTALKFPCVALRKDTVNNEYFYGVARCSPKNIAISSINSGTRTITLASAPIVPLVAGQMFTIFGSSAADGIYTVASASGTSITTNEALPSSTGGNAHLVAYPLTVYRNKRIVSPSEYSIWTLGGGVSVSNGNFAGGVLSPWTATTTGTGSVTTTAGNCALQGSNSSNYGSIAQTLSGPLSLIGFAVQVTVAAGADATIYGAAFGVGINVYRCPAGKTTTFFMRMAAGATPTLNLAPWNYSGTANITNVSALTPRGLVLLRFTTPQIDFNGTPYAIEADCVGVELRNASTEISRLLGIAGITADSTSFANAAAASFAQIVDCDYGRSGQRQISAILDDLLWVARAALSRNNAGAYTIWQDVAGSASQTLDESLGDTLQIDGIGSDGVPSSVGLNYAPSSADANQMQVPLTRTVSGGVLGAQTPRESRYLRDATTADQAICYRALRTQYNRIAQASIFRSIVNLGDILAITCPRMWSGQRTFIAWDVQRIPGGNKLNLREYNAAVYTYTAGTLPPNAPTGYQPDYSFTPPAAPTALTITASGTVVQNDGTVVANVTVNATPPSVNWQQLWFAAIHNVTGEVEMANGVSIGGGNYGCTLGPLRPGEVYKLQCWAVNSNGVQGLVQSTFNATAIGGGASATTFTAAGAPAAPANVASLTATQALGNFVVVSWPALSARNIAAYVLELSYNGGAYSQIYSGLATSFTDSNATYGMPRQYRIRAQDTYGNFSASYTTSASITPTAGTIRGGSSGNQDIGSQTVATANRTDVTTLSGTYTITGSPGGTPFTAISLSHSLGRMPVTSAARAGGASGMATSVGSVTTSAVTLLVFPAQGSTENVTINAVPNTHSHSLLWAGASNTAAIDIW